MQKDIFLSYEADAWYERNRDYINGYRGDEDPVLKVLGNYSISFNNVLEIGCSSGYRLHALSQWHPHASFYGIDPSEKAINTGNELYPSLQLSVGSCDDISHMPSSSVDLMIIGFVFYVVDRELLIKTMSEIDRVLTHNGVLVIVDFYAAKPYLKDYHHIKDGQAFTFKQPYAEMFLATSMYRRIDFSSWNHSTKAQDASEDYDNKFCIDILRRDKINLYK